MTVIKASTDEEARLQVLLHHARRTEEALAKHIITLAKRLNRVTADKAKVEQDMEAVIDRMQAAERKYRQLQSLRYTSRARRNTGIEGVINEH